MGTNLDFKCRHKMWAYGQQLLDGVPGVLEGQPGAGAPAAQHALAGVAAAQQRLRLVLHQAHRRVRRRACRQQPCWLLDAAARVLRYASRTDASAPPVGTQNAR